MQAMIKVIILCVVSGFLSVWIYKRKDSAQICSIVKTFFFYVSLFYAMLIIIKKFSGKTSIALLYGFASDSFAIYLVWSIVLLLFSVAAPVAVRWFFREKADDFISMAVSLITAFSAVVYFVNDEINTRMCFCIIAGGCLVALAVTCFYKKEVRYCTYHNSRERFFSAFPIVSFWTVLVVLYLPNEMYLSNVTDMQIPYGDFVLALVLGSVGYFLVYMAVYMVFLVYFLTEKQLLLVRRAVFAFTAAGYLQSILLNGKMDIMDGVMQEWPEKTIIINLIIWFLILGVVLFLPFFVKKNMDKIYSTICVYLSLVLLVSWGVMRVTTSVEPKTYYELTTDGRMELSSRNNVLVFVLDWFDWQVAEKIFEQDPGFSVPLEDFTWYRNSTSLYAFTSLSVPYLLTGVEWQYDMGGTEYRDYAYGNTSFLTDIAEQGYEIGIYTYSYLLDEKFSDIVRNYSDKVTQRWNYFSVVKGMMQCAKYKACPFFLKDRYWYYADSDFFMAMRKKDPLTLSPGNDKQFYDELLSKGIQVNVGDEYEGAFRFFHLCGAHPPFEPDMLSKGKSCLEMVYDYLEQLKEAGLYDEATIIITADHGHNHLDSDRIDDLKETYDMEKPSSPILFVKKSGQTGENGPEISMAPVSHAEFAATVMEAVDIQTDDYGCAFSDIVEDEERVRTFVFKDGKRYPYEKYEIEGDVRDWNNWRHMEP